MIETQQGVAAVDGHANRIEADFTGARSSAPLRAQPGRGQTAQAGALAGMKPGQGLWKAAWLASMSAGPASLDLDEYERPAVTDDQVDLALASANVAGEQAVAQASQMRGCQVLSQPAEGAPWVGGRPRGGTSR